MRFVVTIRRDPAGVHVRLITHRSDIQCPLVPVNIEIPRVKINNSGDEPCTHLVLCYQEGGWRTALT